jgi:hypothetical protein
MTGCARAGDAADPGSFLGATFAPAMCLDVARALVTSHAEGTEELAVIGVTRNPKLLDEKFEIDGEAVSFFDFAAFHGLELVLRQALEVRPQEVGEETGRDTIYVCIFGGQVGTAVWAAKGGQLGILKACLGVMGRKDVSEDHFRSLFPAVFVGDSVECFGCLCAFAGDAFDLTEFLGWYVSLDRGCLRLCF